MAEQVRIGVVGTSAWAELAYLSNLQGYSRASVTAICGRNRERADELARKYGIAQVFTDYREMIEKGGVDAIVVSVPDDLHYPIVMNALDAGLHVLCEKPLAMNTTQARAMVEKADAAGVKNLIFFSWRWLPLQRYMKQLIDEDYLGRCYDGQFTFYGGFARSGEYGWRYDRQRCNGVWGDLGSHMVDLARWYVGDIDSVSAHLTMFTDHPSENGGAMELSNDSAVATLHFTNGAHATVDVSTVRHVGKAVMGQEIILYGENGTLEARSTLISAELYGARKDEDAIHPLPIPDHLWGDASRSDTFDALRRHHTGGRLFVDAILDSTPLSPNFHDGLKAQQVIDAGIESGQTGRWITIL